MDKALFEKMATLLQWIFDDGEGGPYRPQINEVLVSYSATQQGRNPNDCPICEGKGYWIDGNFEVANCALCEGTGKRIK